MSKPRLSRSVFAPYAKVDTRGGGFEFGMDDRTPVTWILGRARELPKGEYVWWLPDRPAVHEFVRNNRTMIASMNELKAQLRALDQAEFMKKNPILSRIRRAGVRGARYVNRPSQITRGRPSKRLIARRRRALAPHPRGFFPNPSSILGGKSIETRYHGATNTRGARITARVVDGRNYGKSLSIPYPHDLSGYGAHMLAAIKLRDKMDWKDGGDLIGVQTRDGYVFGFAKLAYDEKEIFSAHGDPERYLKNPSVTVRAMGGGRRGMKATNAARERYVKGRRNRFGNGSRLWRTKAGEPFYYVQVRQGAGWKSLYGFTDASELGKRRAVAWAKEVAARFPGKQVRVFWKDSAAGGPRSAGKFHSNPAPIRSFWIGQPGASDVQAASYAEAVKQWREMYAPDGKAYLDTHRKGERVVHFTDANRKHLFTRRVGTVKGFKSNPSPRALEANPQVRAAMTRFEEFTGHRADKAFRAENPVPSVGLEVGPVLMVGYEATRDGRREKYLHRFAKHARPLLVASHDGHSLHMIGGSYRFTDRGITDSR